MIGMDRSRIDALLFTPDRIPDFSLYYAKNTYFKYTTRIEDIRDRMFAKPPLIGGAVRYLRRVMG